MKLLGAIMLWLVSWGTLAGEPVILTISGNIELQGRSHEQVDYTLTQLQALPQGEITTAHPWSEQPRTYRGLDLRVLLEDLFGHARIQTIYLEALNGFSVAVDWQEVAPYDPLLAWSENGRLMSRRDKGPLWLILPYDKAPELQQAEFLHYMAWQLRHIKVRTEPQ
ncbi:molybdopterin-binding protein [Oceanimonas sp. CHS3-5]|uniref:molybdopterin-binding protein n=1 Tax=Oceanimonas sp. CHS3-5 TaxID=3068186 RepID=UPI00273D0F9C|nr:molybdopterin-binding protein [Oceanimonas sp. CHS3-5]MDP5293770.1 molybdopterin-binding protein [Oceanimonas sp. CHS3-5]